MSYKNKKRNSGCGCSILFFGGMIFLIILFIIVSRENQVDYKEEYIENTKYLSIDTAKRYGLLPSVILAQSALESNFGTSKLSSEHKNYFGIKSNKQGAYVDFNTSEFVEGEELTLKESFRKYNTKEESFQDYAVLITQSKRYVPVKEASNYEDAATQLYNCGYATDPNYSKKIISIIEEYNLRDLDLEVIN